MPKKNEFPIEPIKHTMIALRCILLLVIFYVVVSIIILAYTDRAEFLTQIVVYSIAGFFTFFMGYFGWVLASQITEWLTKRN